MGHTKNENENGNGKTSRTETMVIQAPNFGTIEMTIIGTAPLVVNRFGAKARDMIHETQAGGSTSKKGKKREPKDFQKCYEDSFHRFENGDYGIPAGAFRNAMVSACKLCGFHMTKAKLAVFVEADGFEKLDGTPLVRITKGKPSYHETYVRNETGVVDLRARGMFDPGWEAVIRIRFDADMFTSGDIANLMARVGMQVGIGEGRPDSHKSCGMGWGLFALKAEEGGAK